MEVPNKSQTQFHLHHYGTTILKKCLEWKPASPRTSWKSEDTSFANIMMFGISRMAWLSLFHASTDLRSQSSAWHQRCLNQVDALAAFWTREKTTCWEQATSSFKYCSCLGLTFRCEIWRPQRAENVPIWPLGCSSPKSNPKCCDLFGWVVDEFHDYPAIAPPKPPSTSLISENHLSITVSFDTQKCLERVF